MSMSANVRVGLSVCLSEFVSRMEQDDTSGLHEAVAQSDPLQVIQK